MRNLKLYTLLLLLTISASGQQSLNEGDTVYFDFSKKEGDVFNSVMISRIMRMGIGAGPIDMLPFYSYGVVKNTEKDRKGREWINVELYKCYSIPTYSRIVRIYDVEKALSSGEIMPMNEIAEFYEFFFLDEDRDRAKKLTAELAASNQDMERHRNILRTMIDRSYDMRYKLIQEMGYIY